MFTGENIAFFAIGLLLVAFGLFQSRAMSLTSDPGELGGRNINSAELQSLIEAKSDLVILDIRTPGEMGRGMIPSAVGINLYDRDFDLKVSELSTDSPVVIYCATGRRSRTAMSKLNDMGFRELYNLRGGINDWRRNGNAVE